MKKNKKEILKEVELFTPAKSRFSTDLAKVEINYELEDSTPYALPLSTRRARTPEPKRKKKVDYSERSPSPTILQRKPFKNTPSNGPPTPLPEIEPKREF